MKKYILLLSALCVVLLIQAQSPILVGMTSEGGLPDGAGAIMQYTGGDTFITQEDVLSLGNPVNSTLTEAPNGKFYGLTDDGANGTDALIEYDYATNTYTVLANFNDSTGTYPVCSLLLVGDSTFYGLGYLGGANNSGTIFSYTIGADSITKLVDMPPHAYPYSSLIKASDGNLYGMTHQDGAHNSGTIFRYNISSNTYTPLYSLPPYSFPIGSLLEAGPDTLYGMATNDSARFPNTGYIFSYIISSGFFSQLYFFPGTHTYAEGTLIRATDGLLYGMTTNGGSNEMPTDYATGGILFNFNTGTGLFDTLHNFGGGTDGEGPEGDLYQASNGIIYGMTNSGGTTNQGTIFQYDISAHTYALNVNLNGATGYYPGWGHLTEYQAPTVTGIKDVKTYQFSLYPNPTAGSFTVQHNYTGKLAVQIINTLGERLKSFYITGSRGQFDIGDLPAGIYEVQLSDGTQTLKVMKVVKQ